jgi:hypothetical protein
MSCGVSWAPVASFRASEKYGESGHLDMILDALWIFFVSYINIYIYPSGVMWVEYGHMTYDAQWLMSYDVTTINVMIYM